MDSYKLFDFGLLYLDWPTSIYTLVMFLIALISLHFLLFKPIINTLNKREKDTEKRIDSIEEKKAKIEDLKLKIKTNLSENQKKIHEERNKQIKEVMSEVKIMIDDKKQSIADRMLQSESRLEEEIQHSYSDAKEEVQKISQLINKKIVAQSN